MKKYKHIFFDLDRTLWDFDYNSRITLNYIFEKLNLSSRGISFVLFFETYKIVNKHLWLKYRDGILTKEKLRLTRFKETLSKLGISDQSLSNKISSLYVQNSPRQTRLLPNAKHILGFLKERYQLHIITNGFKEVQIIKLKNSDIYHYFQNIIISEDVGALKPNKKIFLYTIDLCKSNAKECLMVGDDLISDILGAKQVGVDQVFFSYNKMKAKYQPTYTIYDLKDLENIL